MSAPPVFPRLSLLLLALALPLALTSCDRLWPKGGEVRALELPGTVDARQVDVGFLVPGRILRLATDEGQRVRRGQLVAELDPVDYQLAADRAEAQAQSAAQALAALRAGARPQELGAARAAVQQAQADAAFATEQVERDRKLVEQKFLSPQQLEKDRSLAAMADARVEQAKQNEALLKAGARKEDIQRAEADVKAADDAVRSAREQLAHVRVDSPVDGVVSVRMAEAGQVVSAAQPVFRITELGHPWVRIYLAEADLPRVQLGQAAQVRVDGLPGKVFEGHLAFISPEAEFTPKTVETKALRVDLVYRAKVEVDDPGGMLKVGMPADVTLPLAAPNPS